MKYVFLIAIAFFSASVSHAEILDTPSFIIHIKVNCEEGNVTCEKVTYVGTSKKTGKSIALNGKTLHSKCADGVTPCGFQGYEFKKRTMLYQVLEGGELVVMHGDKVLVQEHGTWKK